MGIKPFNIQFSSCNAFETFYSIGDTLIENSIKQSLIFVHALSGNRILNWIQRKTGTKQNWKEIFFDISQTHTRTVSMK